MCTVDDTDIDGEAFMPREETPVLDTSVLCVKCKKAACLFLRKKDSYCKDCLVAHVYHKCRAALGKTRQMRTTDKVLVGFSGSPASVVLLDILSKGKGMEYHKKLVYPIVFCYVDDGGVRGESLEKRKQVVETVKKLIESYGCEFHVAALTLSPEFDHEDDAIANLFKRVRSQTSKEDLLTKIRLRTLITVARKFECNKILTAENQESIAVGLLTKIALGMGEQASQQVGFLNDLLPPLTILRPMGEIDNKEIFYYIQFNNLATIERSREINPASIQNLTSGFINGLKEEFPSTVPTIYRTAAKCGLMRKLDSETVCCLCDAAHIVRDAETPYSADDAMAFSKSVSQLGTSGDLPKNELEQMRAWFCHGCLTIITEIGPEVMLEKIRRGDHSKPFLFDFSAMKVSP